MKCVLDNKDATGEHQLWHTLLVVPKEFLDVEPETKLSSTATPTAEESPDVEPKAEIAEDLRHAAIISSIADINVRMNTMESKMDEMMTDLKKLLVAFETKNLSTI